MRFQKLKSNSFCVRGRHRCAMTKVLSDITSKGSKVRIGYCSICNRRKSLTVSDNPFQAEVLGDFFKNLGKKGPYVLKKMAKKTF